jgi:hypothetical protein
MADHPGSQALGLADIEKPLKLHQRRQKSPGPNVTPGASGRYILAGCSCVVQVKREAGRTRIAQAGAETQARDQIVAAILPPIGMGQWPSHLSQVVDITRGWWSALDTITPTL